MGRVCGEALISITVRPRCPQILVIVGQIACGIVILACLKYGNNSFSRVDDTYEET